MASKIEICVHEGKLIGVMEKSVYGDCYTAFRGIPYAKPPIGELRFKDPVPAEPWSGDRDASKHGNISVQLNHFTGEIEGDEDCLYLNVYTTKIEPSKKRSVMVWIHGGAFSSGSGDACVFGPDHIIRKDIVLVTLNYRLGALGFLNLNDKVATGNQGIKDVILALHWLQKNISKFSGDPKNVTIFGVSAGASIVHCLTLSPLAKDLFHKAISQSGVMKCPWALIERQPPSLNKGFQLAEKLGKATADPKVAYEFLKTIDAKKLVETTQKFLLTKAEREQHCITFSPSLDHESSNPVFPENSETFLSRTVKIPFLLGFTNCEGFFVLLDDYMKCITKENLKNFDADFKSAILPAYLSKTSVTVEELRSLYFGDKSISEETVMNYIDFIGDLLFYRDIMSVVDMQTKTNGDNNQTYLYKFSYKSENTFTKNVFNIQIPGVSHGEEQKYLFYPQAKNSSKEADNSEPLPAADSEDYKMINCLTQMWTDFAKTGNPTPVTNLWLPVGKKDGIYNYLDIDTHSQIKVFRKGEERWDWEERINKLKR